jgi:hypothetical protein
MSSNIGYKSSWYETHSDWNYKQKRKFKSNSLQINNFNTLLFISLILIIIYIPFNFCLFNFNIFKNSSMHLGKSDTSNNQNSNFCQNILIYLFKNKYFIYLSLTLITLFIICILYFLKIFEYLYYKIIKPNIEFFTGCSYTSYKDLINTKKNINKLIKNKNYNKLYNFFTRIIILLIILLIIIAIVIYIFTNIYDYYE